MNIPGHLAIAVIQHRLLDLDNNHKTMLLMATSSLAPDMVDKTIGYVFKWMPNGRHYAHNLFALIGTTFIIRWLLGKSAGYTWLSGYVGHLCADDVVEIPWFFPVLSYHFLPGNGIRFKLKSMAVEALFLTLALAFHRFSRLD